MNDVRVVYDEAMTAYDLGPSHPLRPERFSLAVSLMRSLGMLAEDGPSSAGSGRAEIVSPPPAAVEDVERVHAPEYVAAVRAASADPASFVPAMGLGTGDNPVVAGMHEASLLICGGAVLGLRSVLDGDARATFNVAGGLHHAHRARAAGFCVYNDLAVAIAAALARDPGLRLAYVDVDAHHGDGVQEAFYDDPRVLTLSVHESGMFLFPGTGFAQESGDGDGRGYALNVALPAPATDACYALVLAEAVAPALRAFRPDAIVAQLGADTHHADPLTQLGLTLPGYRALVGDIVGLADECCGGRLAASGGGGYGAYSVVPRAWTLALAEMLRVDPPEELPEEWRRSSAEASGGETPPERLSEDGGFVLEPSAEERLLERTRAAIDDLRAHTPLLGRR